MARDESRDGYGADFRQLSMRPHWNDHESLDPNYRGGGYHGMRMEPGTRGRAAYGWNRQVQDPDLGRFGGFDGRYGGHRGGRFDEEGLFRDPFDERYPTNLGQPHRRMPLQHGAGWSDKHLPASRRPGGR